MLFGKHADRPRAVLVRRSIRLASLGGRTTLIGNKSILSLVNRCVLDAQALAARFTRFRIVNGLSSGSIRATSPLRGSAMFPLRDDLVDLTVLK